MLHLSNSELIFVLNEIKYPTETEGQAIFCLENPEESPENPKQSLFFPGGDMGFLAAFFEASKQYGFEINHKKLLSSYKEVSKGKIFLHPEQKKCFHLSRIFKTIEIDKEDKIFLTEIKNLKKIEKEPKVLKPDVFLFIKGKYCFQGKVRIKTKEGRKILSFFIYNETNLIKRANMLVSLLFDKKGVQLPNSLDQEFVREAFLERLDYHLWDNLIKSFKEVPIKRIVFNDSGKIIKFEDFGSL